MYLSAGRLEVVYAGDPNSLTHDNTVCYPDGTDNGTTKLCNTVTLAQTRKLGQIQLNYFLRMLKKAQGNYLPDQQWRYNNPRYQTPVHENCLSFPGLGPPRLVN